MSTTSGPLSVTIRLSLPLLAAVLAAGGCGGHEESVRPEISAESQAISLPEERAARTTFALKKGTKMTFAGTLDGADITITCTKFTASAPTPTGTMLTLAKPPGISGCMGSEGGTPTVTTNDDHGKWKVEETEDNTWMKLIVPEGGITFQSNTIEGCTVTGAPTAKVVFDDLYDSTGAWKGTYTMDGLPLNIGATGCTSSSTLSVSATIEVK